MAERRTIQNWGAHLNVEGEPLTIEQAMLLHLGHQNSRLQQLINLMQDMQMRLTRIELYMQATLPNYDEITRRAALRLMEAQPVEVLEDDDERSTG